MLAVASGKNRISGQWEKIKSKNNIPIEDSKRENSIYARIDARFSEKEAKYLKEIYLSVISASKKVEGNEL